jgi:phytanoyl-CoA hydroxylase
MLSQPQIKFYNDKGYLLVEDAVSRDQLSRMRDIAYCFIEKSRAVSVSDDVFDLDDGHSPQSPKLTRIKLPHKQHPYFWEVAKSSGITQVLRQLLGPNVLLQTSKLNTKAPDGGAAVEWHQDWAFYPHTNDDVLATGIYLDDCDLDNGPLMVVPGSHKGPTFDHHADGRFCGAMNPDACDIDFDKAVPLMGPAGSMTIHHVRLVHGSALNRSNRQRRLLLHEYTAADAWPLLGVANFDEFNSRMVLGEPTIEPRVVPAPVRMPLPPADHQGSIYENQRGAGRRFFATYEEGIRA